MSDALLIGIDAGTSVIKAVAFDLDGRQIGMASRRNSYTTRADGGVEQDMARTWADTAAVLRALSERVDGLASRAIGLGVTGQGDGTWLIDAKGAPTHDGWLWLDARAAEEAGRIQTSDGIDTIYQTTGTGVNVCQMRSQLSWMRQHMPDLIRRAATALHCKDWLYLNLTGELATDPTEAVFTFGDYRTRTYSDEVLAALDLTDLRHMLPPILDGAVETHPLSPQAAEATGLRAGLPVSLGYIDVVCTAIGAGLYDAEAQAGLTILGSTGAHMRFVRDANGVQLNADRTGYTLALPGAALAQLQTNMASTLNIDWALGLAAEVLRGAGIEPNTDDLLRGLDGHISAGRPGAALYHPYISAAGERGPFTDPRARASLTGMDLNTGWSDILRAVCDGLTLAARDCYDAMGPMPDEVRLSGGAARSAELQRLHAAALGVPVRAVAQEEAGAAGAVMIAALALGVFPDADTATRAWVRPLLQPPQAPDPDLMATFDALYTAYRATRDALPPIWEAQMQMRETLK